MKLKTKEQGVVLVITLIMLSVVTLMAIVFLGVSRRERGIVNVTTDHLTAKMAAEAGMARAQSEVIGRMLGSSNRFHFDYAVSTNFVNPSGFDVTDTSFNALNASDRLPNGREISNGFHDSRQCRQPILRSQSAGLCGQHLLQCA